MRSLRSAATSIRDTAESAIPLGSGIPLVCGTTLVSDEKLVTVVVPSRFTFSVNPKPSVKSEVNVGVIPTWSENILNANVLPDVETPSGALNAGPKKLTSKESVFPNVKPSK